VRLAVEGKPPEQLSEAVSLAAYRIVQESLTNARRHAPDSPVDINLVFNAGRISVTVENAAGGSSRNGRNGHPAGVGIQGMSERAAAIGGTLDARAIGERFSVRAELPYVPGR
jgi:signal transduction histidine kinase